MKNVGDNDPIKFNDNLFVKIKNFINKIKYRNCKNILTKTNYLKPINNIDCRKITDVSQMFKGCKTLKSVEVINGYKQIK